ncbi:MAG: hypothetical protein ABSC37_11275 [Xanthobacteraceae bacterium]|jgi:hypothetical protein
MTVSGISASASLQPSGQQVSQSSGQHRHGAVICSPSISDVDGQGSSVASAPSSTGKIGSKINVTA